VFSPFLAGQDLTAALLTAGIDNAFNMKGLTSDLTVSSTTFQDSSDLTFTLTTNASYAFQCQFIYDAPTASDINIRFTTPVGTVIRLAPWGPTTGITGSGALTSISATVTDSTTTATVSFGGAGAGTFMMARPAGALISIGGAGNLVIGFAQAAAGGGSTILKTGSMVALSRFF
jgi:hypothetical protein